MPSLARGTCLVLFAYDIAFSIDLNAAEREITDIKQRETIKHKRRAPKYFQYQPAPLRVTQGVESLAIGGFHTNPAVDLVIYDFGGVSVVYSIPFDGTFSDLLVLSYDLYENLLLSNDSRKRVEQILGTMGKTVTKPSISSFVEDYAIYQIDSFEPNNSAADFVSAQGEVLTQILRAEPRKPSPDEIRDALSQRISFGTDDITIIDWNAAIVVDQDFEDVNAVLEFANVELLEMRHLDQRLDDALTLAYDTLSRRPWQGSPFKSNPGQLHRIAQWQVDNAILFEGVNNALKLLGDQYLSRVYRLAADRFHLAEWDSTILRKIETLDGIYSKISDMMNSRRMEMLEWIIVALITIETAISIFFGFSHH